MTPTINNLTVSGENRGVLHLGTNSDLAIVSNGQACSFTTKIKPLRIKLKGRSKFNNSTCEYFIFNSWGVTNC